MQNYLEHTIGIGNQNLRDKLVNQGFTDLDRLATRDKDFVARAASTIRKQGYAPGIAMTVGVEEDLSHLHKWAKCNNLVQRNLAYADATLVNIRSVGTWMDQLPDKDTAEEPGKFTTQAKFKALMEKLTQYLAVCTNTAGVPILYAIKLQDALPDAADDPGFGLPSFDEELATRGRLDGHYWVSTNRLVWNAIRKMCHGTDAWHHVKRFETARNGRGAHRALMQTHMGEDIQYTLRAAAETTLMSLKFDGRSRNFTYDTFTGRFKDALNELADQNMSEEHKVLKFRKAFQVVEFNHLHGIISSNPTYRNNLDNTIAFVGEQIRSAKQQNGSNQSRNLSSYTKANSKTAHKKWVNPKSKKHKKKRPKPATKFDPNNPGACLTKKAWNEMTPAQQEASRTARNEEQRAASIKSVKTKGYWSPRWMLLFSQLDAKMDAMEVEVRQAIAAFNIDRAHPKDPRRQVAPAMTQRAASKKSAEFYIDDAGNPVSRKA